MKDVKLSVVTSLYRSAAFIEEFYRRISAVAQELNVSYEVVLVNDGSPDNSLEVAKNLSQREANVVVVDLSRNFGHHKALMCGLGQARGELIYLTDIDLEEPPEDLLRYWKELHESSEVVDVVFGQQESRKGKFFEKFSGGLFYWALNKLSDVKITENLVMSRLMTRRYVDSVLLFQESELMLAGIFQMAGYHQKVISVVKSDKGFTTYSLGRKLSLLVNAVTSLSSRPLYYIFYLGILTTAFSLVYIVYLLLMKYLNEITISGWTSMIISLWLLGGMILTSTGILSVYLSKVFIEIKRRPTYIIRDKWSKDQSS